MLRLAHARSNVYVYCYKERSYVCVVSLVG